MARTERRLTIHRLWVRADFDGDCDAASVTRGHRVEQCQKPSPIALASSAKKSVAMLRSEFSERLGGGGWGCQGGNLGLLPPAEVRDDGGDLFGVKLAQILGRRSKLKTTPDGARCRVPDQWDGGPPQSPCRGRGRQVGPVDRGEGAEGSVVACARGGAGSPKSDIDSGELPSVGQPTEIDVSRTDDLHTLEVQRRRSSTSRAKAISPS